jgi:hypothetical protein
MPPPRTQSTLLAQACMLNRAAVGHLPMEPLTELTTTRPGHWLTISVDLLTTTFKLPSHCFAIPIEPPSDICTGVLQQPADGAGTLLGAAVGTASPHVSPAGVHPKALSAITSQVPSLASVMGAHRCAVVGIGHWVLMEGMQHGVQHHDEAVLGWPHQQWVCVCAHGQHACIQQACNACGSGTRRMCRADITGPSFWVMHKCHHPAHRSSVHTAYGVNKPAVLMQYKKTALDSTHVKGASRCQLCLFLSPRFGTTLTRVLEDATSSLFT